MGHASSDDGVGEGGLPAPCEERVESLGSGAGYPGRRLAWLRRGTELTVRLHKDPLSTHSLPPRGPSWDDQA